MKNNKILSLTTNLINLDENVKQKKAQDYLFIDQVFSRHFNYNTNIIRNLKNESEIKKIYEYCEEIFKDISKDLHKELNILHKVNFNERSWKIIYGKWLKEFIYICQKNFLLIHKALNENEISEVICLDSDFILATKNTLEFTKAQRDPDWNFALNSKIFKKINFKKIKTKIKLKLNYFKDNRTNKSNMIMDNLKKTINLFGSNEDNLIYKTTFSFIDEKKLELKIKQFPKIYNEKEVKNGIYDKEIRKKISLLNQTNDKFENLLRELIPQCLPIFIIENFKENLILSKSLGMPKKPNKIFTCYAYAYDELFKIYLAKQVSENHTKYYCGQHGANYFTCIYSEFLQEVNDCDKFLSWGYSDKKIVGTFNLNTFNKKAGFDIKGDLLVIFGSVGSSKSPVERNLVDIKTIENTLDILNSEKLKDISTTIRLHSTFKEHFDSYYYLKYFQKNNLEAKIDLGNSKLLNLQKKSRLSMFNYNSTGLLENLALNIPSISFLEEDCEMNGTKLKKIYSNLFEAKIIFYNKKELISHIYNIWDNINDWWYNKEVQELINEFNNNFNKSAPKNFASFKNYFN